MERDNENELAVRETSEESLPAWKVELNAKLAAHRRRGAESRSAEGQAGEKQESGRGASGASRVAAKVAERYAAAPSYSEMLAASAAAAAAAAADAAQVAVFAAEEASAAVREMNAAAQELLSNLQARESEECGARPGEDDFFGERPGRAESWESVEVAVEHPEPLPLRSEPPVRPMMEPVRGFVDPFVEAVVPAAKSLPTKLIEFPRELIAAHKARPRIAEGPLLEETVPVPSLRIFEVTDVLAGGAEVSMGGEFHAGERGRSEPRRGVTALKARGDEGASGWQSIRLGEHPVTQPARGPVRVEAEPMRVRVPDTVMPLYVATLSDRAKAALVDIGIVGVAFGLFLAVFAACTAHLQVDRVVVAGGAMVLLGMFLLYGWLFLSYGGATPGMRYVRIAVCTFADENPTRTVLRGRVAASLLAVLPLGLGVLWALFDEDGLGWHDRLTKSYQRSYR
jgi:uncharacterized RDD family membrane protein YckC